MSAELLTIIVSVLLIGLFVLLYVFVKKRETNKPEAERQAIKQEHRNYYRMLIRFVGISFILLGLGLGSFSAITAGVATDTSGVSPGGRLLLILLGAFIIYAASWGG